MLISTALQKTKSISELTNQLLSARYRCGRSEVRLPGWSNRTQCRQRLATVATFLRSCVAQALRREDGPGHSLHASA